MKSKINTAQTNKENVRKRMIEQGEKVRKLKGKFIKMKQIEAQLKRLKILEETLTCLAKKSMINDNLSSY